MTKSERKTTKSVVQNAHIYKQVILCNVRMKKDLYGPLMNREAVLYNKCLALDAGRMAVNGNKSCRGRSVSRKKPQRQINKQVNNKQVKAEAADQ